ncbi:hypothetical protein DTO164E3_501 [Paecilomyces variotii]|uniref:Uncharacterized protein n=1 Tax=Byssochlamys spectabilis TaxID=264951 RepID=A0A443I8H6_BYSSP|nr:hypothetical protein C8Q69DRAFT_441334 [Paecilomyces variotii]KAJ9207227.1 hypothetical protein DTO164E3_501 [Paecilomyces variotii]KAJ9365842.1 hypothetical protein DTO280E4_138 [Paecilomyces variotii]RWR00297.1 hypothetical protein C8Q69DRAFT_441334 [Paecilomyces variotii]
MAAEESGLAKLDAFIAELLSDWNIYSTLITGIIVAFLVYGLVSSKEPDCHPYLLARQASEAPVRHPGESAAHRNLETPFGFPLKTGLNIKDPGAPKWTGGRNGDLRDIWRAAVRGAVNDDGSVSGKKGKIYTVLGRHVEEHSLDDITQEINVIGQYIRDSKANTVVICLSDSIELLGAIFAGAFYGFKTVIIPHNLPSEVLTEYLQKSQAELLIAEAGAVDLSVVTKGNQQLSHVLWVAKQGSRHMEWDQVPEGIGGRLEVAVWHELIKDKKGSITSELPEWEPKSPTPSITTVWPTASGVGEFIEYEPKNLVSAVGALISALPRNQRLTSDDLLLSIDSLSRSYPLSLVLAALFSNASIALNSVAGEGVDFALATVGVSPTAIVASSRTMSEYHKKFMEPHTGIISKISRWFQARSLDAGTMPSSNLLTKLANIGPTAELSLDKLRLLFISHRADAPGEYCLSSEQLADLRIFTGARVVYALAGPGVAGAIAQTNVFDYRRQDGLSHFGAPLSSVEVTLKGHPEDAGLERAVEGQIAVAGPAVVSGKTTMPASGRFGDDNTLHLSA